MNIFEIFCAGDGRINEPNMSSALHFLLSPHAPHGLGISSLTEFLWPLSDDLMALRTQGRAMARGRQPDLRHLVAGFDRIEMTLEEKVFNPTEGGKPKFRDIDLTLRCFAGDVAPALVIAIENKIDANSAGDPMQLADEYAFLRTKIDADYPRNGTSGTRIPIAFLYLTPDALEGTTQAQWSALALPASALPGGCDFKAHYTWRDTPTPGARAASVTAIARSLLRKEQDGTISPASSHASLFLRSMVKFIANDFSAERADPGAFDEVNNAKEILGADQFWKAWADAKPGSQALARALHERVAAALNAKAQARGLERPEVAFTKTRIGFFLAGERPVAIMLQNPTTQGRVAVQVKQGGDAGFIDRLQPFREDHQVDAKLDGINLEVQVPVTIPLPSLDRLVQALVGQLP